jgi:hypothetical protein
MATDFNVFADASNGLTSDVFLITRGGAGMNLALGQFYAAETAALLVGTQGSGYGAKIGLGGNLNSDQFIIIRNTNNGSQATSSIVLNAFGNSWAMRMGSAANNANNLEFTNDSINQVGNIRLRLTIAGLLLPGADNTQNIGSGSARWNGIWLGTSPNVTSDERDKTDVVAIPDAWLDAWTDVALVTFTLTEGASPGVGVIAQQVIAAFAVHNLDAEEMGLVHRAAIEPVPADGRPDRLFVAYDFAATLQAAWQRRELARHADTVSALEARLAALEAN